LRKQYNKTTTVSIFLNVANVQLAQNLHSSWTCIPFDEPDYDLATAVLNMPNVPNSHSQMSANPIFMQCAWPYVKCLYGAYDSFSSLWKAHAIRKRRW